MEGHQSHAQSMGNASEIVFDVVGVKSMVLLMRLHKKDSQPSRTTFFHFVSGSSLWQERAENNPVCTRQQKKTIQAMS